MLEVVVLDDAQDFAALEKEWDELYGNAPLATPFQSWACLYSWWEFYGEPYELRLVTMRNEQGLLVGIMPFMLERQRGFGKLLFVGTGPVDYLDVLTREGWKAEVSEAGAWAIKELGSWHVVDLQQVRPEAAVWDIFRSWTELRTYVWQESCLMIEVKPWDELVGSLSKNLRKTARRALRRVEADGVSCEIAKPADAERAARRLMALHRDMWRGRDIYSEHLTRRLESYVIAWVRRMTARDLGGVSEFWRDGEVVISCFWVSGKDFLGTYMLGASPEALERYQINSLYIWDAVNIAYSKNNGWLDLLRGEEPYKLRWGPKIAPSQRLILGGNPVFWGPYASYHTLRSRARRYAASEDAPRWVKKAKDSYQILRNKIGRL